MIFTEEELDNLSTLARITITPEEKPKMLSDMQAILGHISEINEVEGSVARGEESVSNVVREDVVINITGEKTESILGEAPATEGDYVKVMQVLK